MFPHFQKKKMFPHFQKNKMFFLLKKRRLENPKPESRLTSGQLQVQYFDILKQVSNQFDINTIAFFSWEHLRWN